MRVVVLRCCHPYSAEIASDGATAAKLVQAFPECRLSLHDARMPHGVRRVPGQRGCVDSFRTGVGRDFDTSSQTYGTERK